MFLTTSLEIAADAMIKRLNEIAHGKTTVELYPHRLKFYVSTITSHDCQFRHFLVEEEGEQNAAFKTLEDLALFCDYQVKKLKQ